MTWTKRSQWIMYLGVAFCLHSCAIYSFSGGSLSADVKTFSIADFQSNVALGPPDLAEQFAEALGKELLQRRPDLIRLIQDVSLDQMKHFFTSQF